MVFGVRVSKKLLYFYSVHILWPASKLGFGIHVTEKPGHNITLVMLIWPLQIFICLAEAKSEEQQRMA